MMQGVGSEVESVTAGTAPKDLSEGRERSVEEGEENRGGTQVEANGLIRGGCLLGYCRRKGDGVLEGMEKVVGKEIDDNLVQE